MSGTKPEDVRAAEEYLKAHGRVGGSSLKTVEAFLAGCTHVRTSVEWMALEEIAETARVFSAQFKTIEYRPKSLSEIDQMYVAVSCTNVDIALNILDRIRKEGESE